MNAKDRESRGHVPQHSIPQPVLDCHPGSVCRHEGFQAHEEAAARTPQTPRPKPAPSDPTQTSTLEEGFWEPLPRKVYVRTDHSPARGLSKG